jgi:phosphoribosylaminoimidazole-succinocarboxamide synthase
VNVPPPPHAIMRDLENLEALMNDEAIFETRIGNLELIARGKVRDIYAIGADHMLIVTTDRFSAFDVVFDEPIPRKGELLTEVSNFWFERTAGLISNHLSNLDLRDYVSAEDYQRFQARSIIVKRLETLPVEAIVRGYVIGSGWKDYQASADFHAFHQGRGRRSRHQRQLRRGSRENRRRQGQRHP